jgi:hypothetical protein
MNQGSVQNRYKDQWHKTDMKTSETDRGSRYESTQLHPPNFSERCQTHMMEK